MIVLTSTSKISDIRKQGNHFAFTLDQTFKETKIEMTFNVELSPDSMNRLIASKYENFLTENPPFNSISGISVISTNCLQISSKIKGSFRQSLAGLSFPLEVKLEGIEINSKNLDDKFVLILSSNPNSTNYKYYLSDMSIHNLTRMLGSPNLNAIKGNDSYQFCIDSPNSLSVTFNLPAESSKFYLAYVPLN